MQTFLPYKDFTASAHCLDRLRLGKQRVEARQILDCLRENGSRGWAHHPAVRMWRGYDNMLAVYGIAVCVAWRARGYRDSLLDYFVDSLTRLPSRMSIPPWLGDPAFHASHRANLLRKYPAFYTQYGWTEPHDLPYIWPDPRAYIAEAILCS